MIDRLMSASSSPNTTSSSQSASSDRALDKNAFLSLLVTQLQHQDPLKPMDNTEYIAQLAQFSSLEQMQQMNSNLVTLAQANAAAQAPSLIGKTITAVTPDGEISGVVSAVVYDSGRPELVVGDAKVNPAYVTRVEG